MQAFFISLISVAAAEMGDKTQLLTFILATHFKKPLPIIGGIIVATLLNHAVAAFIGVWIGKSLSGNIIHIVLFISFFIAAIWVLIPDKLDEKTMKSSIHASSVFITTAIAFFLAEIGDKTQVVTAILAAQFQTIIPVILGTTCGMLLANIPVVVLGNKATQYISLKIIKFVAAGIFIILGIIELLKSDLITNYLTFANHTIWHWF